MVTVNITLSKSDYEYIVEELKAARQNTYIKHTVETLDKEEIIERSNIANAHIDHVLQMLK